MEKWRVRVQGGFHVLFEDTGTGAGAGIADDDVCASSWLLRLCKQEPDAISAARESLLRDAKDGRREMGMRAVQAVLEEAYSPLSWVDAVYVPQTRHVVLSGLDLDTLQLAYEQFCAHTGFHHAAAVPRLVARGAMLVQDVFASAGGNVPGVEIKPKCPIPYSYYGREAARMRLQRAFADAPDDVEGVLSTYLPATHHELKQHEKHAKQRAKCKDAPRHDHQSAASWYHPADLYSGERERVEHAARALLAHPQNNLRLFYRKHIVALSSGQDALADNSRILLECFSTHEQGMQYGHGQPDMVALAQARLAEMVCAHAKLFHIILELQKASSHSVECIVDIFDSVLNDLMARRPDADDAAAVSFLQQAMCHADNVSDAGRCPFASGTSSSRAEPTASCSSQSLAWRLAALRAFLLSRTAMDCSVLFSICSDHPERGAAPARAFVVDVEPLKSIRKIDHYVAHETRLARHVLTP